MDHFFAETKRLMQFFVRQPAFIFGILVMQGNKIVTAGLSTAFYVILAVIFGRIMCKTRS